MDITEKEKIVLERLSAYLDDDVRHKKYKEVLCRMITFAIFEFIDKVQERNVEISSKDIEDFAHDFVEKISK